MGQWDRFIILIAEDDANDTLLLRRAFEKNGMDAPLHISADGADAIAYLQGAGPYADREKYPFPGAIVTDLKMPRCSGFELLEWVKNHAECSVIPTIILSASAENKDVMRCFELGANAYFQKPANFSDLCELVKVNYQFWSHSVLPIAPKKC
jgi:CheY-like chemotaxis protein